MMPTVLQGVPQVTSRGEGCIEKEIQHIQSVVDSRHRDLTDGIAGPTNSRLALESQLLSYPIPPRCADWIRGRNLAARGYETSTSTTTTATLSPPPPTSARSIKAWATWSGLCPTRAAWIWTQEAYPWSPSEQSSLGRASLARRSGRG